MATPHVLRIAGLIAVLSSGCGLEAQVNSVGGAFDRTVPVDGPVTLTVTNGAGDIRVTPGPDDAVHVIGNISAREPLFGGLNAAERVRHLEANPPIVQDGNALRIGDITDRSLTGNLRIDYEIIVPAQTTVVSRGGSGDQQIGAITGPVEAVAGSGI